MTDRQDLDRIVRRERGRLIADLVKRLGAGRLDLAEDVAQDALVAAMRHWPYRGMPENPGAWLATVARNRAFDRLKREQREVSIVDDDAPAAAPSGADGLFAATVEDPELRLMLICCNDQANEIERLTLTLKLVSGFTAKEIAAALIEKPAATGQRLARLKRRLKGAGPALAEPPSRFGIAERLASVHKVIYLMFSLGYAPQSGDRALNREVAYESLRLACELADNAPTDTPDSDALAALLCFQSSRLDAREDDAGNVVLLADQDTALWDRELIELGLSYLKSSKRANALSRYHLEAGIASLYATAPSWERCDWPSIVALYGQLETLTGSPVVTINASVAEAMGGDPKRALERLNAIADHPTLSGFPPLHLARAEVHRLLDESERAAECYAAALACGLASPVEAHIRGRLATVL